MDDEEDPAGCVALDETLDVPSSFRVGRETPSALEEKRTAALIAARDAADQANQLKSVEEVDRMKTEALRLLSHESRTPLNGIVAPLEMLLEDETMAADERRELYGWMRESAEMLQRFLERTNKFCSMSAGAWKLDCAPVSLSEVVRAASARVSATALERNVKIVEEVLQDDRVASDANELEELIVGLLNNALDASQPGRTIEVRVDTDADQGRVHVVDHGRGFESDELARVFQACSGPDVVHHSQGHGLTLAIARQFLRRQDGDIEVQSQSGVGSTVSICLPLVGAAVEVSAGCERRV